MVKIEALAIFPNIRCIIMGFAFWRRYAKNAVVESHDGGRSSPLLTLYKTVIFFFFWTLVFFFFLDEVNSYVELLEHDDVSSDI